MMVMRDVGLYTVKKMSREFSANETVTVTVKFNDVAIERKYEYDVLIEYNDDIVNVAYVRRREIIGDNNNVYVAYTYKVAYRSNTAIIIIAKTIKDPDKVEHKIMLDCGVLVNEDDWSRHMSFSVLRNKAVHEIYEHVAMFVAYVIDEALNKIPETVLKT